MHSGGGQNVVATLRARADGKVVVYPRDSSGGQVANQLLNYKIKTDVDLQNKATNSPTQSTPTIVDLGKKLLQYARDSDVDGVKATLARGAPFAADWLGMSAMHFAAMNDQLEICEILLHGGINKDAKTKVDRTPLHLAAFYGNLRIAELLLSKKCAVNPLDMLRMTPLHWAVEKKHKAIVRLLLKHNADVTVASKFGKTPIAIAVLTEQADLMKELENARETQIKHKQKEVTEKEISEAVNSIVDDEDDNNEQQLGGKQNIVKFVGAAEIIHNIDEHKENDTFNNNRDDDESIDILKMAVLKDLKEEMYNHNSTMNMLKSHGISMMPEDDDNSKEMLNTALQNGRQLVLSEGGRMLLHETQQQQQQQQYQQQQQHHNIKFIDGNRNSGGISQNLSNSNKNIIKTKDISATLNVSGGGSISRHKNIRIISFNDFKKLCGDKKPNTIQKIPASLASSGVVRQLADGTKLVNMRQMQSRKLRTNPRANESAASNTDDSMIIEDNETAESSLSNNESTHKRSSMIYYPNNKQMVGAVQTLQIRPLPTKMNSGLAAGGSGGAIKKPQLRSSSNVTATTPSGGGSNTDSKSTVQNVLPLLTMSEVCRQLLELRRQNEDLRRKLESAQMEKEELRHRIERLEELVLTEQIEPIQAENEP